MIRAIENPQPAGENATSAATQFGPGYDHDWSLLVFYVDGIANHVGLSIPRLGMADLSLRGARIIAADDQSRPKGELLELPLWLPEPAAALDFLQQPGALDRRIVAQERASRGWHLTPPAPAFVRTFRDTRSKDVDEMNCVEWIARALELGGMEMPDWVMTPEEIERWAYSQQGKSSPSRREQT